jgi:fatty acid elongase 3
MPGTVFSMGICDIGSVPSTITTDSQLRHDIRTRLDQLSYMDLGDEGQDFWFHPSQTPLATSRETTAAIITYYLVVSGGVVLMRNRPAFDLRNTVRVHNLSLTFISGMLLILFICALVPALRKNGIFDGICGSTGWSQKLVILYYLNYLVKYFELLDTVFLILRKKPLSLLHVYHHGATVFLCHIELVGRIPVSWVPITLNLIVHVLMYW